MPDASGPPYAYPDPLPAEAKQAHLQAIGAHKRRLNRWVLLAFIPGFTLALIPVLSGLISGPSLWDTDGGVARTLLIAGSVGCVVGLVPAVLISRSMRRHVRLLRSYGVPVDSAGIEHGSVRTGGT